MKARSAAAAAAAAKHRRGARAQKAIDGQTKEDNRVKKVGRVQAKNLNRFRTVDELVAEFEAKTTRKEQEQLVHEELEVYKEFYQGVVVVTKGGEETTLGNARDEDDLPYWQKTKQGKPRKLAVRYANLRYLIRWMSGTTRDDTSANAKRLIAKGTRAAKPMSAKEAIEAAKASPAAIKSRTGWKTAADRVTTMRKTFGFIPRLAGDKEGPEGYIAAFAEDGSLIWRPPVHRTQLV